MYIQYVLENHNSPFVLNTCILAKKQTLQLLDFHDLDLGSYCRVTLIDLCLHILILFISENFLWMVRRTYRWTLRLALLGQLGEVDLKTSMNFD